MSMAKNKKKKSKASVSPKQKGSRNQDFEKELDEFYEIAKGISNVGKDGVSMSGDNDGDNLLYTSSSLSNNSTGNLHMWATNGSPHSIVSGSTNSGMGFNSGIRGGVNNSIESIFINVTKHLDELDVIQLLHSIKQNNEYLYHQCLSNLLSFPNFRLMSEQFIMDHLEDFKTINPSFNFEMTYGNILENMTGLKLLLKLKDK
jgi:hypothetical protein